MTASAHLLQQFESAHVAMRAMDYQLMQAMNKPDAARAYRGMGTAVSAVYGIETLDGLDRADKRGLYTLATALNALWGASWGSMNRYDGDVTKDGYWRAYRLRLWVAYAAVCELMFDDCGLTFDNLY